ncbi:hypothetical protein niasHT_002044 [Heterodera trifolii]|uniref:Copper transport protein n=1 Tax=Heterodera trifolii TaxID=157864 RepID=A0ABD2M2S4_9BILA
MPKMDMTFHFRTSEFILLREWLPQSLFAYLFSLLAVLALSVAYELLRVFRAILFQIAERRQSEECCSPVASAAFAAPSSGAITASSSSVAACNCLSPQLFYNVPKWTFSSQLVSHFHLFQSLLHFIQFFLGFSLMLVAMTYNVPIFVALLSGHSLGYFLTAPLYRHGLAEENRTGGDCCCS